MNPKRINRDDLLDDARFWALLYEYWVKPRVGDPLWDGEDYFFCVREQEEKDFFSELEGKWVGEGYYPEYSILLPLRNHWRVGVSLSMCPEDFEIQDVLSPPFSDDLVVFGVNGGNSQLPALRWDELLIISDSVKPQELISKARAVLLLFPSVCLSAETNLNEVQRTIINCWQESGISTRHADELVARCLEGPIDDILWSKDPKYGWINNSRHSLRNPKVTGASRVLPFAKRFFSDLEKS